MMKIQLHLWTNFDQKRNFNHLESKFDRFRPPLPQIPLNQCSLLRDIALILKFFQSMTLISIALLLRLLHFTTLLFRFIRLTFPVPLHDDRMFTDLTMSCIASLITTGPNKAFWILALLHADDSMATLVPVGPYVRLIIHLAPAYHQSQQW